MAFQSCICGSRNWRISTLLLLLTACNGVYAVDSSVARIAGPTAQPDLRNIETGSVIPDEGYCDQPYVVINPDGSWLCVLTTGTGHEGNDGQHIVSTISRDHGKTWSKLTDIEPADVPEASWVMPLKVPSGRVYAFYVFNKENLRSVTAYAVKGKTKGRRREDKSPVSIRSVRMSFDIPTTAV